MLNGPPRRKTRRKVVFPNSHLLKQHSATAIPEPPPCATSSTTTDRTYQKPHRLNNKNMMRKPLPIWFDRSYVEEEFETESSELQQETTEECRPFLTASSPMLNDYGLPPLARDKHKRFLQRTLGRLPPGLAALDASKPWILYWSLNGLALLGEDMSSYRKSLVDTLRPIQNKTGGFGGGHGQYSHLATTYSAILALIIVGGDDAYDLIDRTALWQWLGSLKQEGGDFAICDGGERDVRAAYCTMVLLSLLHLPLELPPDSLARSAGHKTFMSGLPEWISGCQTYEGGLGSAPGTEAHGAYVFCALACLCILGDPAAMMTKYLDLPRLIKWLSARQHAPEGGLAGRTNKLVDGCYSHWIGGCWSLVEAAVSGSSVSSREVATVPRLWSREGLIRYVLCCCQADGGGLRDKPSKHPDAYHTNYNLVGLSSAQNHVEYKSTDDFSTESLNAPYCWTSKTTSPSSDNEQIFNEEQRVLPIHPVYVVPAGVAERAHEYFASRPLEISLQRRTSRTSRATLDSPSRNQDHQPETTHAIPFHNQNPTP